MTGDIGSHDRCARGERSARVEVDLDAIAHNVAWLASRAEPARLMAVVKADGYGHGAVRVAEAALGAGAHMLAVALVQEGIELRRAGIDAPILLLSEQPEDQIGDIFEYELVPTVYTDEYIDALCAEARLRNRTGCEVHLKIDTGMNRVGTHPTRAVQRATRVLASGPWLFLKGVYTHFSSADEIGSGTVVEQNRRFNAALDDIGSAGIDVPVVHMANSAATLVLADSHRDLVRVGIAMYGIPPSHDLEGHCHDLRPALAVKASVSLVKRVAKGEGVSYGARHRCQTDTTIVTVPIGYADGIPRRAGTAGLDVLIRGRRHPIVGVVTMDQLMVDVGDEVVDEGDEVVIIGSQAGETISVGEVADKLDTIGYEVVCGLSSRLPRHHLES